MGFTFSHPALIIPFKYIHRRFYSLTGLITGSMIPDLEYFIRWNTRSDYSHTLGGIFWFDMPAALVCMFIFHLIIRDVMINNTPAPLKSKLIRFRDFSWLEYFRRNWVLVVFSTFIGILSHLFWDAFTAYDGFFVQKSSFLMSSSDLILLKTRNYKIVKYVSSLIGLIFIIGQLKFLSPKPTNAAVPNNHYWALIGLITVPLSGIRMHLTDPDDLSLNSIFKISISSLMLGLLIASLYFKERGKKNKTEGIS